MFKQYSELFYPPDASIGAPSIGTAQPASDMSKEDMIEFLQDEDEKPEIIPLDDKKPEKEDKEDRKLDAKAEPEEAEEEETDEEEDELKELEEELKEPTEEQLELVTPVRRKEILKKYPALFKDFPYLEKAYYREQQFTEILSTIDDAREAKDKAETYDKFDEDLRQGNTEVILRAIKQTNPNSFNKVVDDYMTTLAKVDSDAHMHVIGNTVKHTIASMVQEARRSDNNALLQAAQILNQYVFGSSDYVPPKKLSVETTVEDKQNTELQQRERAIIQRQYESARTDLNTRVNNTLKNTIVANIDPKGSMSEYIKKNATREATETLESLINKDTRFQALLGKLWEGAFKTNFDKASTDRIKAAFTSKAKTLLPSVIKKARNEALKGTGRKVVEQDTDEDDSSSKKGPVEKTGRSQSHSSSGKSKDVPKEMSTLDYLMQD